MQLNYAQMDEKYLEVHHLPLLASVATTLEDGGWYQSSLPHYESLALLCKQQAKYRCETRSAFLSQGET